VKPSRAAFGGTLADAGFKSFRPSIVPAESGPIAVIDIGSNSIRLVVFEGLAREPAPIFNEKVFAALGKTVGETGRLNPDGVSQAFSTLTRFSRLLKAMRVETCHVVATAAVRDAADGIAFLEEVKRRAELNITIISGEEEGRLSAEGVLSGIPDADGVMGDMGGGSVELVRLLNGVVGQRTTMPFGPFRLMAVGGTYQSQVAAVDARLASLPWLPDVQGAAVYAVGGIWRAFAKVHMEHVGHPLHIIHHYAIEAREAVEFAQFLSRLSRASIEGTGISRRRVDSLPYAALFMERLLKRAQPARLVFSAFGLREGILHDLLPPETRALDPLLSACDGVARRLGRFGATDPLIAWMRPLGPQSSSLARLALATCLLSDIGWVEHPDYRGEQAYLRALRMPFGGIDHVGRAFIALALDIRYGGRADDPVTSVSHALLDEMTFRHAVSLGLQLRLAYTLSGGALTLLDSTSLAREGSRLILRIARDAADLRVDAVERRLDALARSLEITGEIWIESASPAAGI
jgi:exopolyphosphatase/guanosine-5'-triphosphate,3'-diphosphate pyrophosphatase